MVGAGLLMQGVGDALARTGHPALVLPLFFTGLLFIFVPCAWRLTGVDATRAERVWVSLVLGLGLLASYIFRSPLLLDGFDELAHGATLMGLLDGRSLFASNTVLPVGPDYPGLELLTVAIKWLTGLPLILDQLIVILLARVVLVLCIFLVVERVCRSARAGGIGVLAYAASPQFYSFDAQYAYETLALAFAAAVVYLLFVTTDARRPRVGRLFALALGGIAAMVVTHHVTAWLTIGFLVVWAVGLRLIVDAPALPPPGPSQPVWLPTTRRDQSRIVGRAAAIALVLGGAWTAVVGSRLTGYVGPIFQTASSDLSAALGHLHGNRQLFQNAAGGGSPTWVIALMLAAAVCWCLILLASIYSIIWKRPIRGGKLRYLVLVIAAAYPLALLTSVSATSKLVGGRATTFIFFGVAVVVGGWLGGRLSPGRRRSERLGIIVVATICFLGSTLFGGGPLPSYVPGPYLVGADERSIGSPSLALANWVAANLPVGSHVATDRDNGVLLGDLGHISPVTAIGGLVNASSLYFDSSLTPFDISLIRAADIRYIVIDTRLAEGLPLYGDYIAAGESSGPTPVRLTLAELDKFSSIPGVRRIYDNGPIQVYDLAPFLGGASSAPGAAAIHASGGTELNLGVLLLAVLVAAVWGRRLRRRVRHFGMDPHLVLCGLVGAMVVGLLGAFVILLVHLPPEPTALGALLVVLALGLYPADRPGQGWWNRRRRSPAPEPSPADVSAANSRSDPGGTAETAMSAWASGIPEPAPGGKGPGRTRPRRSQIALGCAGLLLIGLGASLATVTARNEWVPPPELSLAQEGSQPVAMVDLGSGGPTAARLDVINRGRVDWSAPVPPRVGRQAVLIPPGLVHPTSQVRLVSSGYSTREVDGLPTVAVPTPCPTVASGPLGRCCSALRLANQPVQLCKSP